MVERKKVLLSLSLILVLSFSALTAILPSASADLISKPNRSTGAYLSVNPHLIGLNQPLTVNIQIYPSPAGPNIEAGSTTTALFRDNNATGYDGRPLYGAHFTNVTATFTRPDGTKDTFLPLDGSYKALNIVPGMTEEVGTMWFTYQPNQVGDWTVQFSFPGQRFTVLNWTVWYEPSVSQVVKFTVQKDPVQIGLPPVSLPSGYWTKPISPNNREWATIGGDWVDNTIFSGLGSGDINLGSSNNIISFGGGFNPYTTAPNSSHVLWTKSDGTTAAGVAGGLLNNLDYAGSGASVYSVWSGRIYYTKTSPLNGTQIVCANQYTGETIWERPGTISKMYVMAAAWTNLAEYSGYPNAYIWSCTADSWTRINAWTGAADTTIPAPAGFSLPTTTILWDYTYTLAYFTQLGQWNSATYRRPYVNMIGVNVSTPGTFNQKIMFNVSLIQPDGTGPGQGGRVQIAGGGQGFILRQQLCTLTINVPGDTDVYGYNMTTGAFLWKETPGFMQLAHTSSGWTADDHFITYDSSTMCYHCYDATVHPWKELWVSDPGEYPWDSSLGATACQAYGNMYSGSFGGHVRAYDLTTGKVLWDYFTGSTSETVYGAWPAMQGSGAAAGSPLAADGKIYISTTEHTPTLPLFRGARLLCLDAFTGKLLWSVDGWYDISAAAGGYLYARNLYDGLTYCFGKGQTTTSVVASPKTPTTGNRVLIEGSVLDQSPAQPGTPAISDDTMGPWMNYQHAQVSTPTTIPANDTWGTPVTVTGVPVTLTAVAPDGSNINIGSTTSDGYGNFYFTWTPPGNGIYKIQATFAGSESYWSSTAETAVTVGAASASASTAPTPTASTSTSQTSPSQSGSAASPSASVSASSSPSVAPPPSTAASSSMTLYIAIAAAVVVIAVIAVALFLKRSK